MLYCLFQAKKNVIFLIILCINIYYVISSVSSKKNVICNTVLRLLLL